jgi:hypothetical protein
VTILFAGSGRFSLDARLWRDRPPHQGGAPRPASAISLLLLVILVAVVTWVTLKGTDPIHFGTPTA